MIKGALVVTNNNLSNKIFEQNKDYQNDRGFMNIYSALKKIFFDFGVDLNTQDYYKKSEADFYLYADYNNNFNNSNIKNSFLIVREPPTALKTKHLKSNEAKFEKIITWDDTKVDNKKYIKYNYSYNFNNYNKNLKKFKKDREKLSVMIFRKNFSTHKDQLYTKRENIIKWYQENDSKSFDLYGKDWDKFQIRTYPLTFFNRFNLTDKLFSGFNFINDSVYKGQINNKQDVMMDYYFSYCYENIANIHGYISEKIFDCLFSATIPIYLGASNILDHIPKEIFIDARNFNSISDINNYIKSRSKKQISLIQDNIIDYINSEKIIVHSPERNAEIIVQTVIKSIQ